MLDTKATIKPLNPTLRRILAETPVLPTPPPEPAPVKQLAEKEVPRFAYPHAAFDIRIQRRWVEWCQWLHGFIAQARCRGLVRAFADFALHAAIWPSRKYVSVREFFRVVTSGKVSNAEKLARDKACDGCAGQLKRIVSPRGKEPYTVGYCLLCNCPEWFMSRLDRKNRYKGWYCPRRKHDSVYPDDAYRKLIPLDQLANHAGGCSNCGGK